MQLVCQRQTSEAVDRTNSAVEHLQLQTKIRQLEAFVRVQRDRLETLSAHLSLE